MTTDMTLTERRIKLRDQVLMKGPEHFDMDDWFIESDGEEGADCMTLNMAGDIDIESCGTTACLAGHGALVMNEQKQHIECADDVAWYFGLDSSAFYVCSWSSIQVGDWNMYDAYVHNKEDNEYLRAQWITVIEYLDQLIKQDS